MKVICTYNLEHERSTIHKLRNPFNQKLNKWSASEIGKGMKWVYGKRGVMDGSSSEIGEEGEMGLWKEDYTSALD